MHYAFKKYLLEFNDQWLAVEQDKDHLLLKKPKHPITVPTILSHASGMPFVSAMERRLATFSYSNRNTLRRAVRLRVGSRGHRTGRSYRPARAKKLAESWQQGGKNLFCLVVTGLKPLPRAPKTLPIGWVRS